MGRDRAEIKCQQSTQGPCSTNDQQTRHGQGHRACLVDRHGRYNLDDRTVEVTFPANVLELILASVTGNQARS